MDFSELRVGQRVQLVNEQKYPGRFLAEAEVCSLYHPDRGGQWVRVLLLDDSGTVLHVSPADLDYE